MYVKLSTLNGFHKIKKYHTHILAHPLQSRYPIKQKGYPPYITTIFIQVLELE